MTTLFTRLCLAAGSLLLTAGAALAQGTGGPGAPDSLGIYTFTGALGTETTWPVDRPAANTTFSDMRRGSGVVPSQGGNAFSSTGWTQATAPDTAQYYAFRFTAAAGSTFDLDTLGLSERRSATGILQWEVRSSLDGFAAPLFSTSVPDSVTFRKWRVALPSAFDGVTSVEFRIYGYASEAPAGTWRVDNVYLMGAEGGSGGPSPDVTFGQPTLTVSEGVGMASIPVTINNPSATTATTVWVRPADAPGTATSGTDYTFAPQQLTFPAGSNAMQSVMVMVTDDAAVEGDETINFQLDSVSVGATIGANAALTLTITDNDTATVPEPVVHFSSNMATATEGDTAVVTVTFDLPAATTQPLTVDVVTTDVTATAGSDYTPVSATLTLAPQATAGSYDLTIRVPLTDDAVVEPTEMLHLTLQSAGAGLQIETPDTLMLNVLDNDSTVAQPGTVQFAAAGATVAEGPTRRVALPVTVTLPTATTSSVMFQVKSANGGTAQAGLDYLPVDTMIVVSPRAAGTYAFTASIQLIDDATVEGAETIEVLVDTMSAGLSVGTSSLYTLTIADDDAPVGTPVVAFDTVGFTVSEGVGTVQIPVTISNPSPTTATTVVVRLASNAGTATAGADYTFARQVLTFPAGSSAPQTVTLTVIDDLLPENIETVRLRLDSVSTGAAFDSSAFRFLLGIVDNDTTVSRTSVEFAAATSSALESAGMVNIPVTITNPNPAAATTVRVRIATLAGTATNGTDYTFSTQLLTFPAGSSASQDVMLTLVDDNLVEGDETIRLRIDSVSAGAVLGATALHVLTITDNDTATGTTPPLTTIAAIAGVDAQGVATALNQLVRVRGVVLSQNLRATGYQSALQDRTGGIGLFAPAASTITFPTYADSVEVVGRVTQFRGLTQITIDSFRVLLPSQPLPSARVVTTLDESTESKLVQIAGPLTLVTPSQWSNNTNGFTVDVTDGTTTYAVRVPAGSQLVTAPAPTQPFRVWGIGSQFANTTTAPFLDGYQLLVRFTTDIGIVTATSADAAAPVLALFPNPATDRLTVVAPQAATATVFDALGRAVRTLALTSGTATVDVRDLLPGVYTVRAGAQVQRFVKE